MTATVNYNRVDIAYKTGGSWTVGVALDGAGTDHWHHGVAVLGGSSNRVHNFFKNHDLSDLFQRTLRADDTLEALPAAFFTTSVIGAEAFGTPGVVYDSGGTLKIRVAYQEASGGGSQLQIAKLDSADTPSLSSDADVSAAAVKALALGIISFMSLAVDAQTVYAVWVDSADADLDYDSNADDAGWGTDQSLLATISCNAIFISITNG